MFDIAFSEIVVIGVVALVVIGPEKLPQVARTLGLIAGKLQRYVATVKNEIDREMQLDSLRKLEQETRQTILNTQSHLSESLQKTEVEIQSVVNEASLEKPKTPE